MKLPIALPLTLLTVSLRSLGCSGSDATPSPRESATDSGPGVSTSDSGSAADAGPQGSSGGNPDNTTLSFSTDIYSPILEHHCTGCHGFLPDGGAGSVISFGKLDLSSVDAGYANLVGAFAAGGACGVIAGSPGPLRVDPGAPTRASSTSR